MQLITRYNGPALFCHRNTLFGSYSVNWNWSLYFLSVLCFPIPHWLNSANKDSSVICVCGGFYFNINRVCMCAIVNIISSLFVSRSNTIAFSFENQRSCSQGLKTGCKPVLLTVKCRSWNDLTPFLVPRPGLSTWLEELMNGLLVLRQTSALQIKTRSA